MRLKIVKFEDLKHRPNLKSMPWFKISSLIITDRKLFGLDPDQKWFWICLLCFAAQENSNEVEIDVPWAAHEAGVCEEKILQAIEHFKKNNMITIIKSDKSSVHTCNTRVTPVIHACNTRVAIEKSREEKIINKQQVLKFLPIDLKLAELLKSKIVETNPLARKIKKVNPEKWADHFRLLRKDGVNPDQISQVINWAFNGNYYYAPNIQSAKKFRAEWDRITGDFGKSKQSPNQRPVQTNEATALTVAEAEILARGEKTRKEIIAERK